MLLVVVVVHYGICTPRRHQEMTESIFGVGRRAEVVNLDLPAALINCDSLEVILLHGNVGKRPILVGNLI